MVEEVDKKFDTEAVNIERTSERSFVVEHDDGSQFQCQGAWPESLKGKTRASPPASGKSFAMGASFDKNGNIIRN